MTITEMSGQSDILILLGIGIVIILLIHLIKRVSSLSKMMESVSKMISAIEVNRIVQVPVNETTSLEVGSVVVPNAVIAAISAAVNQYRKENN